MLVKITSNSQSAMFHLIAFVLTWWMEWCHFGAISIMWYLHQCQSGTSFSLPWLNKCSGAIEDAIDITWYWCRYQQPYLTKNVASAFDHLYLTNGMVPLMALLASCDMDTSISAIAWPEKLCCTLLNCLDLMNTVVLLKIPLASHDANASANSVK